MAEKRPLDSAQNGDSYAVCPSCHRLSTNPTSCDRCGTRLSKDNTTECLSSQPKRARTESNSSPANPDRPNSNSARPPSQNGVATTPAPSVVSTGAATMNPVPQQLYMNTMNATSVPSALPQLPTAPPALSGPRPQQLYLNVSNPVYPSLMQSVSATTSTTSLLNSTNGPTSVPNLRPNNGIGLAAPGMMASGLQRAAAPGAVNADPTRTAGQSVLAAAGLATSLPAQQGQFPRNPPPTHQAAPAAVPNNNIPHKFYINVQQIRIGLRGFAPASTVQFKDDGVLFTLKEYPNAPLLLNIRAIMKCRANLLGPLPALFFYLESSCIKQIRTIFHMKEFEFNEKSNIDKVKCVGVFPSALTQREAKLIENIFTVMKSSAQRSEPILETINPEDVLDILYGTWTSVNEIQAAQQDSARPVNNIQTQSRGPPSQMPTASQMLQTTTQMARPPASMARGPVPGMTMAGAAPNRTLAPSVSQVNNGQQPPVLVIPSDSNRWQMMKKGLMVGGVYQVQMQNGQRKYCLWNGQELMPCLVQDTEVQLKCSHLRIGSLKITSTSAVRVQNDNNNRGISFKFTLDERTISMFIPQSGITEAYLCADPQFQALFLYTNNQTSNKICSQCNMSWQSDPFYSATSRKERQRHMILFLKDVNADQKEALLSIKLNVTPPRRFIQEISILKALEILSAIKSNSMVQSKMDDYIGGQKILPKPTLSELDSLVKFVSGKDSVDDDDDDVIMTSEEVGMKCPYTQQVMKEPVQNVRCQHNYEKAAILEFIQRKKAKNIEAKCPYAGCGNQVPLRIQDLKDNHELRAYIAKNHPGKT